MNRYSALFADGAAPAAVSAAPAALVRYRLLIVDDETGVLRALTRAFRQENYDVVTAEGAEQALARLREAPVQVVISDYMMPGMNGSDLLKRIKALYPETIRIMLTGHADTGAVMGAINEGAVYKFVLKPWNDDDLRLTVALALEQFDLLRKNRELSADNVRKSREIKALSRLAVTNRSRLAVMLHKHGLLTLGQLQELHRLQQLHKEPLLKLLLSREWVAETAIRAVLRKELMIDEVALAEFTVSPQVAGLLPRSFCERQWVLPLHLDGHELTIALADPLDEGLIEDLRFTSGLQIKVVGASSGAIQAKLAEIFGGSEMVDFKDLETLTGNADPIDNIEIVIEDDGDASIEDLLRGTDEPPAIRLVNAIILEAIRLGASDIHVHPRTKSVVVRYRIDGVLQDKIQIPHSLHQSLVSRLKIMAELDISERRRPQDGRLTVKTPLRIVDLRLSSLPTINGEKIVMRLLDRNAAVHQLDNLGLGTHDQALIHRAIDKPQGMILATGPTGSGKTTTLYSLLQHNADPGKNYVTIEDPVEYYLDMAGQVLIREKIGLTFPVVLRSILRQDPDVVLLGEIRDFETAEVAFHAALTGHQVFSTLHTNSAIATVTRLLDFGLKRYVVATALEAIIAQRLARKICQGCRSEVARDDVLARRLGGPFHVHAAGLRNWRGLGCPACNRTGYRGRVGLYEVLVPDMAMRDLIAAGANLLDIRRLAAASGLRTLHDDAREKVDQGLTTMEEVLRVLGPDNGAEAIAP
ncbi:Type IV fimbrial assembly, ATPase PilB [Rubrivivax sp. A210]|uniref:ATPase, T2SS/T4P/T4SS family n=1 Tax=Rubrivivax sp. A210 TaxID=2772301 RepID=UPI00191AC6E6|nr:ATPase, T2SS/T4P/T4SS family [Rubrivivax sp. A210]CAD5374365.1 Type IV fimbrial assembly, ATPase PilB [Rubrivivax sp. A210]